MSADREPATSPKRVRVDGDRLSHFLWKLNRSYCRRVHRFGWSGADPLPPRGPGILVCNHRSSVDPFILAAATRRVLSYLIAAEYYAIPGPRWLFRWMHCVPVRRNRQEVSTVRRALHALREGRILCIFPEGGIDRGFEAPALGVGYLAWRSGAPVFPACVTGTPRGRSVWSALVTRSHSCARFGTPLLLGADRRDRPDRKRIAEWTAHLTEIINGLGSK
ncbi:MAG: lysophospholipid acyltransferase family protein [bacterium]